MLQRIFDVFRTKPMLMQVTFPLQPFSGEWESKCSGLTNWHVP